MRAHALTALAALTILAPVMARAATFAVKTGEWRITSTMHMTGTFMPPELMAKLPPQVRDQMTAQMAKMQQPQARNTCLTQEKLDRGFDFNQARAHNCQQHVLQQTTTTLEIQADCTSGDGHATEHGLFTALDRETMQGKFDIQREGSGGPHVMSVDIAGKWLGGTCKDDDTK